MGLHGSCMAVMQLVGRGGICAVGVACIEWGVASIASGVGFGIFRVACDLSKTGKWAGKVHAVSCYVISGDLWNVFK